MYYAVQNCVLELSFHSGKSYKDPFNELEVDVLFEGANDSKRTVPAFWAGENLWKVRFATPTPGRYTYTSVCSDKANMSLHQQKGEIEVGPYKGRNPLFKHGPLKVSGDHHYLEHYDGTPFFWLGDTWWLVLCKRLRWPKDIRTLTEDRVKKGFTVVQFFAGLPPETSPFSFDERVANEAGFPWEEGYTRINPSYFDMADLRIEHMVDSGLLPCIYGLQGLYLPEMGVEKIKQYWRYLIARYGAYPVVWCVAGEATSPFMFSKDKEKDREIQKKGWTEVTRYVREVDGGHNLITIGPPGCAESRNEVEDASLLDFDLLQTVHGDWTVIPLHIDTVLTAVKREPRVPVVLGEVCYEGHGGCSGEIIQRFMFWSGILSGLCGHTYGADGLWQVNTRQKPYGNFISGTTYTTTVWEDIYQSPSSSQLGMAKKLLQRYPWWQLEPHPEWIKSGWTQRAAWNRREDKYFTCFAAGIPKALRIIYFPTQRHAQPVLAGIEKDTQYDAFYYDPITGREYPVGDVKPNQQGEWTAPPFPIFQDGILVLEKKGNDFNQVES